MDSRAGLLSGGDNGPAIDENSPDSSLLLDAVRRQSLEMPPDRPLSTQQVAILEKWIKMGAPWPDHPKVDSQSEGWLANRAAEHWSWKPLRRSQVPRAEGSWPLTPIDSFIHHEHQVRGIQPAPPAANHELIRRLCVDLTGLPPSEQQLSFTLSTQQDFSLLIDQLLASPQFGVHWGRHWLDLMRYSETLGHEFDYPIRNAWRYRDAVINAFNDDLPYDQMLAEHLAGDLSDRPRYHPITGINESLALTAWWWLGDSCHAPVDAKNDWATRTENQVDVFSKAFLGMTVACARCHDHKFDAISVQDYYGLVGVARSIRRRYAITDPHDRIAGQRDLIHEKMIQAQGSVQESWRAAKEENMRQWLERSIVQWRAIPATELNQTFPISSPLFPLKLLVDPAISDETQFAKRFAELRAEAERAQQSFDQWKSESLNLADFSQGLPTGWQFEAVRPEDWNKPPQIDWFEGRFALPVLPNSFRSQAWGLRQQTTLRSPEFKLSHRCVCLKIRGKATQSSVCVNGYFMNEFTGLLFADARKTIDQPTDWGWVVHNGDLNKYIGDPTFISLETDVGGWFEVSEVRLADRGPPTQPHQAALQLLSSNPANRDVLVAQVVEFLGQSFSNCSERTAGSQPSAIEDINKISNETAVVREVLRQASDVALGIAPATKIQLLAQEIQELDGQSPAPTMFIASQEGDPSDAAIELRGNPHLVGDHAPRGCFQSLVPWRDVSPTSSGRAELVQSLTDSGHPLVARVIVNRVWFHLMGRGLVNSPDNLGVLGSRPTHPELLDYLAQRFVENGWSIKWLVREIALSQTYRLSSTPLPEHVDLDPDASFYSHRLVRRLEAEVLRDAILLASGSLDDRLSDPSVAIHLTQQMTGRGRPSASGPLDGDNRRSAFIEVRRNFLSPFLLAFDFPMPSTTTGKRNVSNVPAQALGLLNDPLVGEMCQRWAAHTAVIAEPRQRIANMVSSAFSRTALESEIDRCEDFVRRSGDSGWIDLAHTLINAKEFWYLK